MLGWLTAKAMHKDFAVLMEQRLFPALGMTHTYINVPDARTDYAQGYTQDGKPIRMTGGMLWQPAYGVRTTAADLLRFVQANMGLIETAPRLQRALERTHTGYFRSGPLTQDLIWEQYPYPVALPTLLEGNSMKMLRDGLPAAAIKPPRRARTRGSTRRADQRLQYLCRVRPVEADRDRDAREPQLSERGSREGRVRDPRGARRPAVTFPTPGPVRLMPSAALRTRRRSSACARRLPTCRESPAE